MFEFHSQLHTARRSLKIPELWKQVGLQIWVRRRRYAAFCC